MKRRTGVRVVRLGGDSPLHPSFGPTLATGVPQLARGRRENGPFCLQFDRKRKTASLSALGFGQSLERCVDPNPHRIEDRVALVPLLELGTCQERKLELTVRRQRPASDPTGRRSPELRL